MRIGDTKVTWSFGFKRKSSVEIEDEQKVATPVAWILNGVINLVIFSALGFLFNRFWGLFIPQLARINEFVMALAIGAIALAVILIINRTLPMWAGFEVTVEEVEDKDE